MNKKVGSFSIASTFVGTAIGAGFASGQEIKQFFAAYGIHGIYGTLIVGVGFSILAVIIMMIAYKMQCTKFEVVAVPDIRPLRVFINGFITVLNYGILIIMLAGAGSMIHQLVGWKPLWGSVFMTGLVLMVAWSGSDGILKSFNFIVPLMVICALVVSALVLAQKTQLTNAVSVTVPGIRHNFILSALLFVSYNMAVITGVLAPIGARAAGCKSIITGGVLGGMVLSAMATCLTAAVLKYYPLIVDADMPMLEIARRQSQFWGSVYTFVLIAGIFTTAVGVLFAVLERLAAYDKKVFKNRKALLIVVLFTAAMGSNIGFTRLVATIYPFSGYIGFILIGCLIYNYIAVVLKK